MKLHRFNGEHIDKDLSRLQGHYENELFFNCVFDVVNNLTLKDCVLSNSKFKTNSIKDALGLTVTIGCKSFHNIELSELMFDMMLMLLIDTKGNSKKRARLIKVIGKDRFKELQKEFENIE